jgi:four helix bundle protein
MDNIVRDKSFYFAKRIVKLCGYLREAKKEYTMSQQLLRSGTSIGANIAESEHAQSRPDFASKLNIALKEAAETDYWLRLLRETDYLSQQEFDSIIADCREIESLSASIVKTIKQ